MRNCLTDPDLDKLNPAIDCLRPHLALAARLMLEAGLRVGEVVKLTWADLYFGPAPKTALCLDATITKRHRARTIPLTPRTVAAVNRQRSSVDPGFHDPPAQGAISSKPSGSNITTRTIQREIAALARRTIGKSVTPHTLRHTFATRLLRVSNTRVVQEALGHRRITTTELYTHPNSTDLQHAMDKLT
jgi:integrase/recombinase XerD